MKQSLLVGGLIVGMVAVTQIPELESWRLNTTNQTGYNGLPANVQTIRYSAANVYINSSGIPDYTIGPWSQNPNVPSQQQYFYRFIRTPVPEQGTKRATALGPIGLLTNGVPIYNAADGRSYNNQNVWHQNANVVEAVSFDQCLGHPDQAGRYHHHQNPTCLYQTTAGQHSPIIGYAFDGFPIYGPYGYAQADGSGGVVRMATSYRLRSISQRTTLPDGTVLSAGQYGPPVGPAYPLGYYVEDYEYVAGSGALDESNGRFAVTPEYPNGTYAYFVTIDDTGKSVYPYLLGPTYHGQVATDDFPPAVVRITETVTTYAGAPSGTSTTVPTNTPTTTPTSTTAPTITPTATTTPMPTSTILPGSDSKTFLPLLVR